MIHTSPEADYARLPDDMLATAFQSDRMPQAARLDRLEALEEHAGTLLLGLWQDDPDLMVRGVRLAAVQACIPALRTVIRSQSQGVETARQVSDNLYDFSKEVATADFTSAVSRHGNARHMSGQLSELAVLASVWWGIANGCQDEKSYILPSSTQEDHGRRKDNRQLAADLILRYNGKRPKRYIQVKSRHYAEAERKSLRYHPEVVIITPGDLTGEEENGTNSLLDAITKNDVKALVRANQNTDAALRDAQDRNIEFRKAMRQKRRQGGVRGILPAVAAISTLRPAH